jgi:hypothetical protein
MVDSFHSSTSRMTCTHGQIIRLLWTFRDISISFGHALLSAVAEISRQQLLQEYLRCSNTAPT